MTATSVTALALLVVSLGSVIPPFSADAQDEKRAEDKSRAALEAWLERFPNIPKTQKDGRTTVAVDHQSVHRVFPGERFYGVHFYVNYPHPRTLPAGLKVHNLIVVQSGGAVERIGDREALKAFFEKNLGRIRDEAQASEAAAACVRIAEEFYQDGLYEFHDPEVKVTRRGEDLVAVGEARVKARGSGKVSVTLTFKASGEVGSVGIEGRVRPDVRRR
jgi:hypothetical protein